MTTKPPGTADLMSVIGGHERGGVGLPLAVVCTVHFL